MAHNERNNCGGRACPCPCFSHRNDGQGQALPLHLYQCCALRFRYLLARVSLIALIAALISACAPNKSAPPLNQSSAPRNEQTANSQNNVAPPNVQSANNQNATAQPTQRSLGDPIDTSQYDAKIKNLEARLKRRTADANLKKELSQAFAARADALTDARQYRSALGDYRRALRSDESNARAKEGADLITGIFVSMNREVPAEGTEPPPLPYNTNNADKKNNGTSDDSNGNAPRLPTRADKPTALH